MMSKHAIHTIASYHNFPPPSSLPPSFYLRHPPSSSLPHPPSMISTRGHRLSLRLLTVPDQSAQWDPGGWTGYPTSSTVYSSNTFVITSLSLPRAIRTTINRGYGLMLHLFIVLEQCSQPDRGEQPCYAISSNSWNITKWPLVQHFHCHLPFSFNIHWG